MNSADSNSIDGTGISGRFIYLEVVEDVRSVSTAEDIMCPENG